MIPATMNRTGHGADGGSSGCPPLQLQNSLGAGARNGHVTSTPPLRCALCASCRCRLLWALFVCFRSALLVRARRVSVLECAFWGFPLLSALLHPLLRIPTTTSLCHTTSMDYPGAPRAAVAPAGALVSCLAVHACGFRCCLRSPHHCAPCNIQSKRKSGVNLMSSNVLCVTVGDGTTKRHHSGSEWSKDRHMTTGHSAAAAAQFRDVAMTQQHCSCIEPAPLSVPLQRLFLG